MNAAPHSTCSQPIVAQGVVFIMGDCHLAVGEPERTRLVLDFLDYLPTQARQLIILGDLFDFWLGAKHLRLPDFRDVLDKLQALTGAGIDIRLIPGNRDFLLDEHFSQRTGIRILGDFELLQVGGRKLRLTHGDLLCTDDWRYRLWRRLVRLKGIRTLIAWTPLFLTRWTAVGMRNLSRREVKQKASSTMGFVKSATVAALGDDADALIVGHAHSPETRTLSVGGKEKWVYVLGDWKQVGVFLSVSEEGIHYRAFPSDSSRPLEIPHRAQWSGDEESAGSDSGV